MTEEPTAEEAETIALADEMIVTGEGLNNEERVSVRRIKARILVKGILEGKTLGEAGADAGYKHKQSAHRALAKAYEEGTVQHELALAGLDHSIYAPIIAEIASNKDWKAKKAAIDLLIRLQGTEAPKKHLIVRANYADYAKTTLNGDKAHTIPAQQGHDASVGGGVGVAMVPSVSLLM